MPTNLSRDAQTTLLLTARFGHGGKNSERPLSTREWGALAGWLKGKNLRPSSLLEPGRDDLLSQWHHKKISAERLKALLDRGASMGIALENWQRAGIWVVLRSEPDYPHRLKKHLKHDAPPFFYGVGNRRLLNQRGIAVVGSRNAGEADLQYTRELGVKIAEAAHSVVSGGARGVDQAAMLGALQVEGTAVGVLANDLLRAATSARYRPHLRAGNLLLLSPFSPTARFQGWAVMQRNRYIFCLSDAAIAVHSGTSGGTWNGVQENLRHQWVPMWVKRSDDPAAGNDQLIEQGGKPLSDNVADVAVGTLAEEHAGPVLTGTLNFSGQATPESKEAGSPATASDSEKQPEKKPDKQANGADPVPVAVDNAPDLKQAVHAKSEAAVQPARSVYQYFLDCLAAEAKQQKSFDEIRGSKAFEGMRKVQFEAWLNRAEKDGLLRSFECPDGTDGIRYEWAGSQNHLLLPE